MQTTTTITVRLPISLRDTIVQRAADAEKTQADFIRELLAKGLNQDAETTRLNSISERLDLLAGNVSRILQYIEGEDDR